MVGNRDFSCRVVKTAASPGMILRDPYLVLADASNLSTSLSCRSSESGWPRHVALHRGIWTSFALCERTFHTAAALATDLADELTIF
jgi:hypothetical protein